MKACVWPSVWHTHGWRKINLMLHNGPELNEVALKSCGLTFQLCAFRQSIHAASRVLYWSFYIVCSVLKKNNLQAETIRWGNISHQGAMWRRSQTAWLAALHISISMWDPAGSRCCSLAWQSECEGIRDSYPQFVLWHTRWRWMKLGSFNCVSRHQSLSWLMMAQRVAGSVCSEIYRVKWEVFI